MPAPSVFRISDIQDRIDNLPASGTFIKPFVTVEHSDTMCGGINCLNRISVPWDLTCDELIFCLEGTFRLVVDEDREGQERAATTFLGLLNNTLTYCVE